jgi:hypothetical protein
MFPTTQRPPIRETLADRTWFRAGTVTLSTLLYAAFLVALLGRPVHVVWPDQFEQSLVSLSAEVSSTPGIAFKADVQMHEKSSAPVAKTPRALSQPLVKPSVVNTVNKDSRQTSLPKPKSAGPIVQHASAHQDDVAHIVASLIATQSSGDPLDFQVTRNGIVSQASGTSSSPWAPLRVEGIKDGEADCAIAEGLQSVLQDDTSIKPLLRQVPRSQRSVANVIMAWDGAWVDEPNEIATDANRNEAALTNTFLKVKIQAYLESVSPQCLSHTVSGPAFILINDAREPTVLAFGSGKWRWADLAASAIPTADPVVEALSQILSFGPSLQ